MAKIYESEGTIWIKQEPVNTEDEDPLGNIPDIKEEPIKKGDDCQVLRLDSSWASPGESTSDQKPELNENGAIESKELISKQEDEEKEIKLEATEPVNTTSKNNENFKCAHCEYVASHSVELIDHINATHSSVNTISGDENHSSSQEKHIPYWIDKPISCKHCDFTCKTRGDLKQHLLSQHKGLKILYCPQCDYTTKYSTRLKNHIMAKHTKEKPLSCPYCNYSAVQTSNLKNHITAKHVTMQTLSCPQCSFTCAESKVLKCHMAQHQQT